MGKEIVYCDGCGQQILAEDFERGKACVEGRFCARCRPNAAQSSGSRPAVAVRTPPPKTSPTPKPKTQPTPRPRPVTPRPASPPPVTPRRGGPFAPDQAGIPKVVWIGGGAVVILLLGILLFILAQATPQTESAMAPPGPQPAPRPSAPSPQGPQPTPSPSQPTPQSPSETVAAQFLQEARRKRQQDRSNPAAVLAFVREKIEHLESNNLQDTQGYRGLKEMERELARIVEDQRLQEEARRQFDRIRQLAESPPSLEALRQMDQMAQALPLPQAEPFLPQVEELKRTLAQRLADSVPAQLQNVRASVEEAIREGFRFERARERIFDLLALLDELQNRLGGSYPEVRAELDQLLVRLNRAEEEAYRRERGEEPPAPPRQAPGAPPTQGDWTVLFNGGASHWFESFGLLCTGAWTIAGGELIGTCRMQEGDWHDLLVTPGDWTDYEYELEYRADGQPALLILRYDTSRGAHVSAPLEQTATWRSWRVVVRGSMVEVYVDGQQVARQRLEQLGTRGRVGLGLKPGGTLRLRRALIRSPR